MKIVEPSAAVATAGLLSQGAKEYAAGKTVVAVLTGEDLAADGIGPLICGVTVTSDDGEPHRAPAHPALAQRDGAQATVGPARLGSLERTATGTARSPFGDHRVAGADLWREAD